VREPTLTAHLAALVEVVEFAWVAVGVVVPEAAGAARAVSAQEELAHFLM
jgi:hypothetical protein